MRPVTSPARDPDPSDRWLTVAEVAALQQVSAKTVRQWIATGQLPAARVGRHWRVRAGQLDALLAPPDDRSA